MGVVFLKPNQEIAQKFVYSGCRVCSRFDKEHIDAVIGQLFLPIREKGLFAFGPAFSNDLQRVLDLGNPSQKPPYGSGCMGIYVPWMFSEMLGEDMSLEQALKLAEEQGKASLNGYVESAENLIKSYEIASESNLE